MPKTGAHLKIVEMGDNALGVRLHGDPRKPEPIHFRVTLPGSDVDIVRTQANDYWIHIAVNHEDKPYNPDEPTATINTARLDLLDRAPSETNVGDFDNPNLYHLAVRVTRNGGNKDHGNHHQMS